MSAELSIALPGCSTLVCILRNSSTMDFQKRRSTLQSLAMCRSVLAPSITIEPEWLSSFHIPKSAAPTCSPSNLRATHPQTQQASVQGFTPCRGLRNWLRYHTPPQTWDRLGSVPEHRGCIRHLESWAQQLTVTVLDPSSRQDPLVGQSHIITVPFWNCQATTCISFCLQSATKSNPDMVWVGKHGRWPFCQLHNTN